MRRRDIYMYGVDTTIEIKILRSFVFLKICNKVESRFDPPHKQTTITSV